VGEDLVGRLTELISGIETKLLLSNQGVTARIDATIQQQDAIIRQQDDRFGYVLTQLTAHYEKEDTRHDVWDGELLRITEALGGLRSDGQALQSEFRTGLSGIQATASALIETVDGLQVSMRESQDDRRAIHDELAALKDQITAYIAGSKRDVVSVHDKRLTKLETEALSAINGRLSALEENNAQLAAIRAELSELASRIGDALPTEADQGISTQLRVDEAKRGRRGDG
jgi:DNA repair exonuclease SbcCD ATPase subunit